MPPTLAESIGFCQSLARRTGKNFYWSFLTLPRGMRRDMCVLYAFMRLTDDIGDRDDVPVSARRACLDRWRQLLCAAIKNKPTFTMPPRDQPDADAATTEQLDALDVHGALAFPAVAELIARCRIPDDLLHEVIDGVESDLSLRVIRTRGDFGRYCYQVAGAVGLCCIHIWGYSGGEARQRAIDCGCAFQSTNILRDLREDAHYGRCYLPEDVMEQFGVERSQLANGDLNDNVRRMIQSEVAGAKASYGSAARLLPMLSRPGQRVYAAMLGIYGGLLDEIERRGCDVFSRRIELSRSRKLWAAIRGWLCPGRVARSIAKRYGPGFESPHLDRAS